ncbi:MAG: [Fe-S]-binding protein, partial [Elusimicrobiota bacterium]
MTPDKRKRYWRSQAERDSRAAAAGARPGTSAGDPASLDGSMDRRSFLKAAGFLLGAGALSGCSRSPVFKAIPHLIAPAEVVPGKPLWYATTCGSCSAACGALVKVREGRPIKLEGNPSHPLSQGGLCALGQASVLELYDSRRLKGPLLRGAPSSWPETDSAVAAALREASSGRRSVRVLTGTVNSPTLERSISAMLAGLPDARRVSYDALSSSAILDAHERTHGRRVLPRYRFDEAEVIVGIDADFLGTWISPVEHSASWRKRRVPDGTPPRMSFHAQFESRMSLTGANADRRLLLPAGGEGLLAAHLARALARRAEVFAPYDGLPPCPVDSSELESLADRLWAARERGLVVCGANDLAAQAAVNCAN